MSKKKEEIVIPERLLKSKLKDRTVETHNKHILESKKFPIETLVLGSSLIERFYTTGKEHLLELEYNKILLAGVGGDGVQHLWWRIKDGKIIEKVNENKGDIKQVILMIGTNNIPDEKNTVKLAMAVGEMYKHLKTMVPRVFVMELPPKVEPELPNYDIKEMLDTYNNTLKKVILEKDLVVNWWADLADDEGKPKKEMYDDNVHFSSEGYKVVANTLLELIEDK